MSMYLHFSLRWSYYDSRGALLAARAQGKGVSEQAILRLADSHRNERHRRSEVQEGFTATGSCINRLDQEEAHTVGCCG
jgi:hypothetical protein